jgi:hypothetical protein
MEEDRSGKRRFLIPGKKLELWAGRVVVVGHPSLVVPYCRVSFCPLIVNIVFFFLLNHMTRSRS